MAAEDPVSDQDLSPHGAPLDGLTLPSDSELQPRLPGQQLRNARRPRTFRVGDIRRRLQQERSEALDIRDPIAIRKAGERFEAIMEALMEFPDDIRVDPWNQTVGVSQAAKALGFTAREVRTLIRAGKLPARKVKNEWKIPLNAVL